uniref:Uncharacterized protein n=1 Tax=Moniliophthora roreri TaxID=221103 RepID=A0A0W0GEH8_MONRR
MNIKDWMDAAILFDESYKQAQEYGKTWNEDNGRKPQQSFRKKEEVADCLDATKKEEKKKEELKKLSKKERFTKIRALVNDQTKEEKNLLINLMEQEGF